jgi:phage tail sheath gpL-like
MSNGTATSGRLYQNILNDKSWNTLFGSKSMLSAMIREFKQINNVSALDVIPLSDDLLSIQAVGEVEFTSPIVDGTLILTVGSKKYNSYSYSVFAGDSKGVIAAGFRNLINSDVNSPVDAFLSTKISITVFSGTGNNDMTVSGSYNGNVNKSFEVRIDSTGTPDTFEWSSDGGITWVATTVSITGVAQVLSDGISITFAGTTGHVIGDKWTFNATGKTLQLTAVQGGFEGNGISLSYSSTDPSYIANITHMIGGSVNPTLTNIFDVVSKIRYQTIVWPSSYDLSILQTFLDNRWNVNNNVLDGIGVLSKTDSYGNLITLLNSLNDQNIAIHCNKNISAQNLKGSALVELDYVIASEIGAINALRLTQDANISRYVISTRGLLDSIGGAAIASLPFFNTPMYDLPIVDQANEWTEEEVDGLKNAGGFVLGNNPSLSNIIFGEVVTTYKYDAASNLDDSFKYIEYVETASNVREYFYNNVRNRFAQSRLTAGDVIGGRNMANAGVISAYFDEMYSVLSGSNYVLTQAGEEAMSFFKNNKTVSVDISTGKATVTMIVPIVTQLRSIYAEMQITFDFNQ